ncbi:hypothetical protein [Actinoplanes sp. NPDC051851]|uniref:hypothetical protein n=1 Tax=Actinoplanes sp. NPDC051851 TaxID=3154753 RepID=UPI003442696D
MDDLVDQADRVISALFGPESGIPWWFWGAVVLLIFLKLLYPVIFPELAADEARTEQRLKEFRKERDDLGKGGKKGKKAKKK